MLLMYETAERSIYTDRSNSETEPDEARVHSEVMIQLHCLSSNWLPPLRCW